MTAQERERLYTIDDLREIEQSPENADKQFELIEGVIYEVAGGSSAKPTVIAGIIIYYFNAFVLPRNLGYVSTPDGQYDITPHDSPMPDVAFVSKARQAELPVGKFKLAPDLVVEVVSPTDSAKAVLRKAKRYLELGTKIVWIVYPDDESVDVCTMLPDKSMKIQEFKSTDTLNGGDVLPEFTLEVSKIFVK